MDISQANDNELQKAIDDITNNNQGTATAGANDLEAQIQSQMGVPPVPPVPPTPQEMTAPVMPDATAVPTIPVDAPAPAATPEPELGVVQDVGAQPEAMPDMATVVPEAPVAEPMPPIPETTANEEAPAMTPPTDAQVMDAPAEDSVAPVVEAEPADKSGDFEAVRGEMVRDLYGLLDKVDFSPEEELEIIDEVINETGDKSAIVKGYSIIKGMLGNNNSNEEREIAETLLRWLKSSKRLNKN